MRYFRSYSYLGQSIRSPRWYLRPRFPGYPSIIKATNFGSLSLVDPDNRRPVSGLTTSAPATLRRSKRFRSERALEQCAGMCSATLADGRAKLWTTHRALQLRQQEHAIFRRGEYIALEVAGEHQENVIAFLRRDPASERSVLTVLPRFACTLMRGKLELPLGEAWGKDQLRVSVPPGTRYVNVFTGESVTVTEQGTLALSSLLMSILWRCWSARNRGPKSSMEPALHEGHGFTGCGK